MSDPEGVNLPESLDVLVGFLGDGELTTRIARLEHELEGVRVGDIPPRLNAAKVDRRLLQSALVVRARLGRMNDLIHATAIALASPYEQRSVAEVGRGADRVDEAADDVAEIVGVHAGDVR